MAGVAFHAVLEAPAAALRHHAEARVHQAGEDAVLEGLVEIALQPQLLARP